MLIMKVVLLFDTQMRISFSKRFIESWLMESALKFENSQFLATLTLKSYKVSKSFEYAYWDMKIY